MESERMTDPGNVGITPPEAVTVGITPPEAVTTGGVNAAFDAPDEGGSGGDE